MTIKRKGAEKRKEVSGSYLHKEKGSSFQTASLIPRVRSQWDGRISHQEKPPALPR